MSETPTPVKRYSQATGGDLEEYELGDWVRFEDFELATKARDSLFSQITASLKSENDELKQRIQKYSKVLFKFGVDVDDCSPAEREAETDYERELTALQQKLAVVERERDKEIQRAMDVGNNLFLAIVHRLTPHVENDRSLDWDVLPGTIKGIASERDALRAELEALRAQLATLMDTFAKHQRSTIDSRDAHARNAIQHEVTNTELRATNRELLTALMRFGQHNDRCMCFNANNPCDCGLSAAISNARENASEQETRKETKTCESEPDSSSKTSVGAPSADIGHSTAKSASTVDTDHNEGASGDVPTGTAAPKPDEMPSYAAYWSTCLLVGVTPMSKEEYAQKSTEPIPQPAEATLESDTINGMHGFEDVVSRDFSRNIERQRNAARAERDAALAKLAELTRRDVESIRHINRLATWAQQDPTGPIPVQGIQQWVLNELRQALGSKGAGQTWSPSIAIIQDNDALQKQLAAERTQRLAAEARLAAMAADLKSHEKMVTEYFETWNSLSQCRLEQNFDISLPELVKRQIEYERFAAMQGREKGAE